VTEFPHRPLFRNWDAYHLSATTCEERRRVDSPAANEKSDLRTLFRPNQPFRFVKTPQVYFNKGFAVFVLLS
jgi:hypothetical protein